MYNLLIVDDEPIIVDSLYNLFNNSSNFNFDVYKAYCGSQALTKVKRVKIDIILTDICMPNIDGIQLQKQIVEYWPRCKVIFLTGYDDFHYAHEAIRNKGVDYVLKVEGDEAICKAVEKAVIQIQKEETSERLVLKAKEQMNSMLPFMQKELFSEMLQGHSYSSEERINRFNKLKIPLKSHWPVLLLLTRVDDWKDNRYSEKRLEIIYNIQSIIEEYLKSMVQFLPIVMENSEIIWFIQSIRSCTEEKKEWKKILSFIHGILGSTQKSCNKMLNVTISHAVSNDLCKWEDVGEKFDTLRLILNRKFGFGQEMILTEPYSGYLSCNSRDDKHMNYVMEIQQYLKKMPKLQLHLESGQITEVESIFSSIMKYVCNKKYMEYGLASQIYYSIALVFQACLNEMGITNEITKEIDLSKLMNMDKHTSWEEINQYFRQLSSYIYIFRYERNSENTHGIIEQIQNYIAEHLREDLSLTTLADLVYLNPAYLSRLYKQVTGQGLSSYIVELKLCRAREMLADKVLHINEISEKLGFTSHAYFSRFFKKHMGMTPQAYRDL